MALPRVDSTYHRLCDFGTSSILLFLYYLSHKNQTVFISWRKYWFWNLFGIRRGGSRKRGHADFVFIYFIVILHWYSNSIINATPSPYSTSCDLHLTRKTRRQLLCQPTPTSHRLPRRILHRPIQSDRPGWSPLNLLSSATLLHLNPRRFNIGHPNIDRFFSSKRNICYSKQNNNKKCRNQSYKINSLSSIGWRNSQKR